MSLPLVPTPVVPPIPLQMLDPVNNANKEVSTYRLIVAFSLRLLRNSHIQRQRLEIQVDLLVQLRTNEIRSPRQEEEEICAREVS